MSVVNIGFQPGDFNRDGQVTAADVPAMLQALTDLNVYKATYSLTDPQLLAIGDLNNSNALTNADIQGLLNLVAGFGSAANSPVPEPSSAILAMLGALTVPFFRCH